LNKENRVSGYGRVPTLRISQEFIDSLVIDPCCFSDDLPLGWDLKRSRTKENALWITP
jgi:hypothetical protein